MKSYDLSRIPLRPKFRRVSKQFVLNLPFVCHPDRWLQGSALRAHTGTAGWGERLEAGSQRRPYRRHIHAPSTLFYLEEDARRWDMKLLMLKKRQVRAWSDRTYTPVWRWSTLWGAGTRGCLWGGTGCWDGWSSEPTGTVHTLEKQSRTHTQTHTAVRSESSALLLQSNAKNLSHGV